MSRNLTQVGPRGTISYLYDDADRRTRMTYADSGLYVDYDYLVTGEVSAIRENGATSGIGVLASYAYDDRGRRTSLTRGNGAVTSYSYDNVSRLTELVQNLSGTSHDLTLGFTHNPASQIATNTRSNPGSGPGQADAYAWGGHYGVNRNYTANGLNQYSAAGSITPTYDSRGNLTSAGSTTYGYSSDNMLTSASGGITLTYDPLLRLYETAGGSTTRLAYDGASLIAEYNGSNALLRRYVHGPGVDEPLVWYEGTGTSDRRWLHQDERGSVVAISNGSGSVTNVNAYDESGIPASTNAGRFQYTGQQWIGELGMYHYRARIYSPTFGRFLQTDPIGYGDGMNLYAYVGNDPVNFTDPSGLSADDSEKPPYCVGYDFCGNSGGSQPGIVVIGSRCGMFCISIVPDVFYLQDIRLLGLRMYGNEHGGAGNAPVPDPPDDCPEGTSSDTSRPPDYSGLGSSYGRNRDGSPDQFAGQLTAAGDIMNPDAFTAASVRLRDSQGGLTRQPLIPLRSHVFVTSPRFPGRGATVYVNDTGPLRPGRIIDLSAAAMRHLSGNPVDLIPVEVYMCRPVGQ